MNLDSARNKVKSYLGKKLSFIYKGSRNQKEEFEGFITDCFLSIFVVETTSGVKKSFSYNDFIIKSIKIICE